MIQREEVSLQEYRDLMAHAFGKNEQSLPGTVFFLYEDGIKKAFCSTYIHNAGTMYLQHIGMVEGKGTYKVFSEFVDFLATFQFPCLMGAIETENKVALMWALRNGFKIIGTRMASDKTLYVEVLKAYSEVNQHG